MSTCDRIGHDDFVDDVRSGSDRQGRPWVTTRWKCRNCGRTCTETTGPGA